MIISRTPYRISFFGGGTDYPSWYLKHGGAVLSATINKYCYILCRELSPFYIGDFRVVYSRVEDCATIEDVKHPVVREVLRYFNIKDRLEIQHTGDLPARSGLGSSSSFTVGLLNIIYTFQNVGKSVYWLAKEAIHIEQDILKEVVGSQDQIAAAYGGINRISFDNDGFIVSPLNLKKERLSELNSYLMLVHTGITRIAADTASSYVATFKDKERVLSEFVEHGIIILRGTQDIKEFGTLLNDAWMYKRSWSDKVTNSKIDDIYAAAQMKGAIGGKLLGAGGGGFMLLFVPSIFHQRIKEALKGLVFVPFTFSFNGSTIIYQDG